jgi:Zn-dependent protease
MDPVPYPPDDWPPPTGSPLESSAALGFDVAKLRDWQGPPPPPGVDAADAATNRRRAEGRRGGRIGAGLAAAGAFVAKYGVLLVKLKVLTVMATMFVSIAAYALLWGWAFAVGFVLLLLVHEMGHAIEMRRQGIPASAPMFIPFMGAIISMRGRPIDAYHEARVGLAGPAFGSAASLVVALMASEHHSSFLRALAFIGFFLNLINLFPALPLDGGRAVGALHPVVWLLGLIGLVGVEIWRPSPLVFLIILLGASELWKRWKGRGSLASRLYYNLRKAQRAAIAVAYLALVATCVVGMNATYVARSIR